MISGKDERLVVVCGILTLLFLESTFYRFPKPRSGDRSNCFAAFLLGCTTLVSVSPMAWKRSLVPIRFFHIWKGCCTPLWPVFSSYEEPISLLLFILIGMFGCILCPLIGLGMIVPWVLSGAVPFISPLLSEGPTHYKKYEI